MAHGGEGAFDRVRRSDVLPVFGGEVVEGEQLGAILDQLGHRLVVFHAVGLDEEIEGGFGVSLVSACQMSCRWPLALGWMDFGMAFSTLLVLCTQHRCSRVVPNTSRSAAQKPRAPSPMASSGGLGQPTALEVEQQLAPALGALAVAVGQAQNLLVAPFVRADQHQNALFFLGHPWLEVDAVGPDVDDAPGTQIAALPALILVPPDALSREIVVADRPAAFGPSSAARAS
jgi:hypothetical protein